MYPASTSDFLAIGGLFGKDALDGDDEIRLVDQMLAGLGLAPFGIVGDGFGDALALDQVLDDELALSLLIATLDDGLPWNSSTGMVGPSGWPSSPTGLSSVRSSCAILA